MPRPTMLPTPQPSTDIPGKSPAQVQFDASFALPPAALVRRRDSTSISSVPSNASDSSYRPLSPPSPANAGPSRSLGAASRKRPNNSQNVNKNDGEFSLPPPPTRSRKIIQMKPRAAAATEAGKKVTSPTAGPTASKNSNAATEKATAGGKKKQANGTNTAAGRKIARKTAHSLIERRRRSKMNEEFGTLRDLVPACRGQEMHKLAILQASIEYMRYLEECVAELKNSRQEHQTPKLPAKPQVRTNVDDNDDDPGAESDASMADAPSPHAADISSSHSVVNSQNPCSATPSPAIQPSDASVQSISSDLHHSGQGRFSTASIASSNASPVIFPSSTNPDPRHHSRSHSQSFSHPHTALPSPAISTRGSTSVNMTPLHHAGVPPPFSFLPPPSRTPNNGTGAANSEAGSAVTSPTIAPQQQQPEQNDREDREATAALLMLGSDRRSWKERSASQAAAASLAKAKEKENDGGGNVRRSMSVRDLLSG